MRKYETLLLLSPELSSEEMQAVLDNLKGVLEREGASILAEDDWGMRELAYPVRKVMRGHYYRLEYAVDGKAVQELERIIRITEGIFKFVTVQLDAEYEPTSEEAA
ncbi:30S ribosomal protein S6 [Oceanidesulfovibrio indonesiensis]|uniref:Small ribosomal subunit protein bS6 n=1 Tax=Oceanidesulfovibrio indonesiensis TaxID=54767 RepID=A0A7M3MHB8_9BACT|nr:30S ribosomal protein S6 [Oceanidesulfovibrio indonesiensis]TVM18889.1 30S ribosomal protein S6 [Oceanidesulfovibrio indonesiensis]